MVGPVYVAHNQSIGTVSLLFALLSQLSCHRVVIVASRHFPPVITQLHNLQMGVVGMAWLAAGGFKTVSIVVKTFPR